MSRCLIIFFALLLASNRVVAQLPAGDNFLEDAMKSLKPFGGGSSDSVVKEVTVSGQPFKKALLINTFKKPSVNGEYGLNASISTPLKKGDVLWISFKARSLESKRETGESFIEVRFDQLVNRKYQWPSHLERGISVGPNWTETSIPFILKKDIAPEDAPLVIKFDSFAQRFEISPVTFMNYGQNVKLEDLLRSIVHYDGDAPDATWRKAASMEVLNHC